MHELARHYTVGFHYEDECSQSDGSECMSACSVVGPVTCPRLDVTSPCSSPESPSLLSPDLKFERHSPSISRFVSLILVILNRVVAMENNNELIFVDFPLIQCILTYLTHS